MDFIGSIIFGIFGLQDLCNQFHNKTLLTILKIPKIIDPIKSIQSQSQNLTIFPCHILIIILQSYNLIILQSHNLTILQSHNPTIPQSHNLTISQSHNLTISQSHNLTIPQSHNPKIQQSHTFSSLTTYLPTYLQCRH